MTEAKNSNTVVAAIAIGALCLLFGIGVFRWAADRTEKKELDRQESLVRSQVGQAVGQDLGKGDKLAKPVPEFNFSLAGGGEFGLKDLKGKVWVAQFMFTNCAGFCPQMSKQTELLQERTKDLNDLHFVSFTVDPDRDSLDALLEYGAEYSADNERWHFLRAPQPTVHELGKTGFGLLNDTDSLMHSQKAALVDKNGKIRGYFDGAGPERVADFQAMEALARKLLQE